MLAQKSLVDKSVAAISRALAEDQMVTTNMLRIKLLAPFAFRCLTSEYIPSDSETNAELISGHMYGIY